MKKTVAVQNTLFFILLAIILLMAIYIVVGIVGLLNEGNATSFPWYTPILFAQLVCCIPIAVIAIILSITNYRYYLQSNESDQYANARKRLKQIVAAFIVVAVMTFLPLTFRFPFPISQWLIPDILSFCGFGVMIVSVMFLLKQTTQTRKFA